MCRRTPLPAHISELADTPPSSWRGFPWRGFPWRGFAWLVVNPARWQYIENADMPF